MYKIPSYVLKIRDMPAEDKPREKMDRFGPKVLSVGELVAIILQTGTTKEDVMSMSSRIVKDYGERALTGATDPKQMSEDLDIPINKAMQIVSCAELGRRFFDKKENGPQVIRSAKDVFQYLSDMRNFSKEHLHGIYINTHHAIIHDEVISIGTIDANLVHPREVFKPGIEYGAAAVILAHNHPSGVVMPSKIDIEITKQIIAVGKIIGIPLLDHVIIGRNKFKSIEADYIK